MLVFILKLDDLLEYIAFSSSYSFKPSIKFSFVSPVIRSCMITIPDRSFLRNSFKITNYWAVILTFCIFCAIVVTKTIFIIIPTFVQFYLEKYISFVI